MLGPLRRLMTATVLILEQQHIRAPRDSDNPRVELRGRQGGLWQYILSLFGMGRQFILIADKEEVRLTFREKGGYIDVEEFHMIPLQQRPSVEVKFLAASLLTVLIYICYIAILVVIFSFLGMSSIAIGIGGVGAVFLLAFLSKSMLIVIRGHSEIVLQIRQGILGAELVKAEVMVEIVNAIRDVVLTATLPTTVSSVPSPAPSPAVVNNAAPSLASSSSSEPLPVPSDPTSDEMRVNVDGFEYEVEVIAVPDEDDDEEAEEAIMDDEEEPASSDWSLQAKILREGLIQIAVNGIKRSAFLECKKAVSETYRPLAPEEIELLDQKTGQVIRSLPAMALDAASEAKQLSQLLQNSLKFVRENDLKPIPHLIGLTVFKVLAKEYPNTVEGQKAAKHLQQRSD